MVIVEAVRKTTGETFATILVPLRTASAAHHVVSQLEGHAIIAYTGNGAKNAPKTAQKTAVLDAPRLQVTVMPAKTVYGEVSALWDVWEIIVLSAIK